MRHGFHISIHARITILVALQAVALLLVVFFTLPHVFPWHTLDLSIYYMASLNVLKGALPYRDFPLEYPPLALVPFTLPRLAAPGRPLDFTGYVWRFLIQNALFSTLIALSIVRAVASWRPSRNAAPPLALYASLVAVSAPLLPWRYDLFPALLTAVALVCVLAGQPALAGIWVGLGIAAKLYPVVLLPIFGAYYLAGGNWRALARLALGSIGATALALLPFLLAAPGDVLAFLRYHELRGLQVESLPAGAILLAHVFGRAEVALDFNYGALHLVSPLADAALKWLLVAFVAVYGALLATTLARFRQEHTADGAIADASLVAYVVAGLLAFIVTNKVFSPQYLIWLLPFAPLLPLRQGGLLLAVFAITIAIFPFDYDNLVALRPFPILLLNLRNLLVVGLLLWLVVERLPSAMLVAPGWLQHALRRRARQEQPHS